MNGDTYTTTVKVRKILDGKPARVIVAVPLLWGLLTLTSFVIGVKVTPYALLVMFILFLAVIPMLIYLRRASAPFRGEQSFENKQVTFRAVDKTLYVDDIKLDVTWNDWDESISVENISVYRGVKYKTETYSAKFIGLVEKPYAEGFMTFLKEHDVTIVDSDSRYEG